MYSINNNQYTYRSMYGSPVMHCCEWHNIYTCQFLDSIMTQYWDTFAKMSYYFLILPPWVKIEFTKLYTALFCGYHVFLIEVGHNDINGWRRGWVGDHWYARLCLLHNYNPARIDIALIQLHVLRGLSHSDNCISEGSVSHINGVVCS